MWYLISFLVGCVSMLIISIIAGWINSTKVEQSIKKLKNSTITDTKITGVVKERKKGFLGIGTGKRKSEKANK